MADSNPAAKSFQFPACWNGTPTTATVVVRDGGVEWFPFDGGPCLEMSVEAFEQLAPKVIVAAHTRRPS